MNPHDDGHCFCARGLSYTYPKGGFSVRASSLTLAPGECLALRGGNGAGKTTLGKLMAGLLRPDGGDVLLGGERINGWPLGKIGAAVGYLFQEPSKQIFAPTILEDLIFAPVLQGMPEETARLRAVEILREFELEPLAGAGTYTLSRGEQQRLALAGMLMGSPQFIILDEPTTGLDLRRRGILGRAVGQLLARGIGVLLISHDAGFIAAHAAREMRMEGGVLLG